MASPSLWRSAGPLVLGRLALTVVGFALPVVLARVLDQHEYGTWKQLYLVAYTVSLSLQFGIAQSLLYFVPRATPEERRQWAAQTQVMLSALGVAAFAGIQFVAPVLAVRFSNPQLAEIALPMGAMTAAMIGSAGFELALTARGRTGWSAISLVTTDMVRVVAIIVPVWQGHGVVGAAWGAAGATLFRWFAATLVTTQLTLPRPTFERMKTQLAYALPIGLASLVSMPQAQLHQVFVAATHAPAAFAVYSVGVMQLPIVTLLYVPVSETMQVRLGALEREGRTHLAGPVFADAVDKLAAIFLPFSAMMMAVATPAMTLLYGPGYAAAADVLRIAVVSVAFASLPVDGVLRARARTRTLLWAQGAKLAATWPVLHVGSALAGMHGVIGAQVALEATTKGALLLVISRELRMPMRALLGGARLGRAALVAIGAGTVGALAAGAVKAPFWACAAGGCAAGSVMGIDLLLRRSAGRKADTDTTEPKRVAA